MLNPCEKMVLCLTRENKSLWLEILSIGRSYEVTLETEKEADVLNMVSCRWCLVDNGNLMRVNRIKDINRTHLSIVSGGHNEENNEMGARPCFYS